MVRGRRPDRAETKSAPVSMRTEPRLRHLLEQAAEAKGRSLAQEMEQRLERTFYEDALYGGKDNAVLCRILMHTIQLAEARLGAKWTESPEVYYAARGAVIELLEANRPDQADPASATLTQMSEASAAVEAELEKASEAVEIFEQRHGIHSSTPTSKVVSPGQHANEVGTLTIRGSEEELEHMVANLFSTVPLPGAGHLNDKDKSDYAKLLAKRVATLRAQPAAAARLAAAVKELQKYTEKHCEIGRSIAIEFFRIRGNPIAE